jgi:hypothetical protein
MYDSVYSFNNPRVPQFMDIISPLQLEIPEVGDVKIRDSM